MIIDKPGDEAVITYQTVTGGQTTLHAKNDGKWYYNGVEINSGGSQHHHVISRAPVLADVDGWDIDGVVLRVKEEPEIVSTDTTKALFEAVKTYVMLPYVPPEPVPLALSLERRNVTGASASGYALFAGGSSRINNNTVYRDTVDAFDEALQRVLPQTLSIARQSMGAVTIGNYALFGGGSLGANSVRYINVDAYDAALQRTLPAPLTGSPWGVESPRTAVAGSYALFGGGSIQNGSTSAVDAYDAALQRTTVRMSVSSNSHNAVSAGSYALFTGGYSAGLLGGLFFINAFDETLQRVGVEPLIQNRQHPSPGTVGRFGIFAGGRRPGVNPFTATEAYSDTLQRTDVMPLSVARSGPPSARLGNRVFFSGSYIVDAYDDTLQRTVPMTLSPESAGTVASNRSHILFAGASLIDAFDSSYGL
jgi:hypothetical protein